MTNAMAASTQGSAVEVAALRAQLADAQSSSAAAVSERDSLRAELARARAALGEQARRSSTQLQEAQARAREVQEALRARERQLESMSEQQGQLLREVRGGRSVVLWDAAHACLCSGQHNHPATQFRM